jgi:uncharacterized protein
MKTFFKETQPMRLKNLVLILMVFAAACGPRADETSPEMVQDMLKLRGYKFTETEFFRAINLEDAQAVRAFLQGGMNPNAKNEKGETALTYAIQNKDPKIVKALLEKADVNLQDDAGNSPIHLAVKNEKDEIFDWLLEKNADVNVGGAAGKTKNQTALYAAVLRDREELARRLIERGANPNIADSGGAFPLSEAVAKAGANPAMVKLLLDAGANVNAQEANKGTALIYAASNKSIAPQTRAEIVRLLLDKGADKTALDWAKESGHKDTAEILK